MAQLIVGPVPFAFLGGSVQPFKKTGAEVLQAKLPQSLIVYPTAFFPLLDYGG
jgi:hypothetical protein